MYQHSSTGFNCNMCPWGTKQCTYMGHDGPQPTTHDALACPLFYHTAVLPRLSCSVYGAAFIPNTRAMRIVVLSFLCGQVESRAARRGKKMKSASVRCCVGGVLVSFGFYGSFLRTASSLLRRLPTSTTSICEYLPFAFFVWLCKQHFSFFILHYSYREAKVTRVSTRVQIYKHPRDTHRHTQAQASTQTAFNHEQMSKMPIKYENVLPSPWFPWYSNIPVLVNEYGMLHFFLYRAYEPTYYTSARMIPGIYMYISKY